jgi:ribosome-associated translation inhibitor RaiA
MRVVISSHGLSFDTQIRTYAEYRLFSTLAPHDNVLGARVRLRHVDDAVQCSVHVTLRPLGSVHARSSAPHAAAAIDRAAERIAAVMHEHRLSLST